MSRACTSQNAEGKTSHWAQEGSCLPSSENHDWPHSLTPSATGQRVCVDVRLPHTLNLLTWRPSVLVVEAPHTQSVTVLTVHRVTELTSALE